MQETMQDLSLHTRRTDGCLAWVCGWTGKPENPWRFHYDASRGTNSS